MAKIKMKYDFLGNDFWNNIINNRKMKERINAQKKTIVSWMWLILVYMCTVSVSFLNPMCVCVCVFLFRIYLQFFFWGISTSNSIDKIMSIRKWEICELDWDRERRERRRDRVKKYRQNWKVMHLNWNDFQE